MIIWLCAGFIVVGFLVLMRRFALVEKSRKIINLAHHSFLVIRSSSLSDDEKETTLQKKAKELWVLFFQLVLGSAVAVLLPIGVLWVLDRFGLISLEAVFALTVSSAFLFVSSVLIIAVIVLLKLNKKNRK